MPALPGHTDARLIRAISRWALVAFAINLTIGAGIIGLQGRVQALAGNYSIAVIVSIGVVLLLYSLIQIVCVGTLPNLVTSQRPLADAAVAFVGPVGAIVIALTAVVACAGVYGASFTPGTRLLFAMADRGQLPARFGEVHSRYRTPVNTIIATSAVVLVLALSGSFIYLVKVTLIARISVYAFTCATLPILRRRSDVPEAAFVLRGGPALAFLAIACCLLALASSSMRELLDVAAAVVLGLILLVVSRMSRRTPALRRVPDPLP